MHIQIIVGVLYVIFVILFVVAFITLLLKKEGSWKKARIEFLIAILSILLSLAIQYGFDFVREKVLPADKDIKKNTDLENIGHNTEKIQNDEKIHTHKKYKEEKENYIAATCTEAGSYEAVEYCECGNEINREKVTIKALGHSYNSVITKPTCVEQGFTTYVCSRCNDTYVEEYIDALGHDYKEGVCNYCGYADPDYVKVYDSKEIMKILSNSVVSDSGAYKGYLGGESISVFAEERYNCFSINTAVSYNLWGHEVQNVIFNVSNLNEINVLKFDIGGETGSSGAMKVEIFKDKTLDDVADDIYELDASAIPTSVSVSIKGVTSLGIRVTNLSNNENRLVFFNFSDGIE